MTVDRVIAIIFVIICLIYGHTAFVTMEAGLLPFELNMTFLPNTLPKWLSVLGVILGLIVILKPRMETLDSNDRVEIDYGKLGQYKVGQAVLLIGLMITYTLLLRPIGFITATALFIIAGGTILGDRRYRTLIPLGILTAITIWYLAQEVLGVFLRPWPWFI